jgi:hypothetical protein
MRFMDREARIKTLLEEAGNAKAWFAQYAGELKYDPTNERVLRLQELCRNEFNKRWDQLDELAATGNASEGKRKRPRIEE